MKRVIPASITMIAYALSLLGVGWLTFFVAFPGSNAFTALIIPAVGAILMTVCAVLALRIGSNRTLGMIGIHAGLIIPLVIALGAGMRLRGSLEKSLAFNKQVRTEAVAVSPITRETREQLRPMGYQSVGIGSITALSLFAFVSLVSLRPKPEKHEAEENPGPAEEREKGRPSLERADPEDVA